MSSRYKRSVRLKEQNDQYKRDHPAFIIPSSFYNIVHVHKFTSIDTIEALINHFETCNYYSIDTESDCNTYELSLIQIHSIPQQLPAYVVLFELKHLPLPNSILMDKIKLSFNILFRLGNVIYSWGCMRTELEDAVHLNLFTWPVLSSLTNLQKKFFNWYRTGLPPCEVCGPNRFSLMNVSSLPCDCSLYSPYFNYNETWSIQNAIYYTINKFLDKSSSRKNWSTILDSQYSSLTSNEQVKRLNYAIYDCFAVTILHKPIREDWTLAQLRTTELFKLFTSDKSVRVPITLMKVGEIIDTEPKSQLIPSFSSIDYANTSSYRTTTFHPPNILEDISDDDDEIFISSLTNPTDSNTLVNPNQHVEDHLDPISDDDIIQPDYDALLNIARRDELNRDVVIINDDIQSDRTNPQLDNVKVKSRRSVRSTEARSRRNQKRNRIKRLSRDNHVLIREVYHRFTIKQVKQVLYDQGVHPVHIKPIRSTNYISIGVKNESLIDAYFECIPGDLFDKKHYYEYYPDRH